MKLLYIDIDSLRPDHMGCYGYGRGTTPCIDEFAEGAVRFELCFAADSPCMPSRASTFCGRFGIRNGIVDHEYVQMQGQANDWMRDWSHLREHAPTMPAAFAAQGIGTGSISTFRRHPAPWFTFGFNLLVDPQMDGNMQHVLAEEVNGLALPWIERHTDSEWFLHVQYWDPHTPYQRSDAEIDRFFDTDVLVPDLTEEDIERMQADDHWRSAAFGGLKSFDDYRRLLAKYDAEIAHVDREVGRVLDLLDKIGIADETVVVISADHGEEFGEHGVFSEHWSVYDGTQRVPLLVRVPGSGWTGVRSGMALNIDLAPTLLELAGLEAAADWDGVSLVPALRGELDVVRDSVPLSHGLYTAQRGWRTRDWKLVQTLSGGEWEIPSLQLFDMRSDVHERSDVSSSHPERVSSMKADLDAWVAAMLEKSGRDDPLVACAARHEKRQVQ